MFPRSGVRTTFGLSAKASGVNRTSNASVSLMSAIRGRAIDLSKNLPRKIGNRQSGSDLHLATDRPEIGKDWLKQRFLQKRNGRSTAGAFLGANSPFDQFDVAITPFL